MSIEAFKKHVRAVTKFPWCGQELYLRKIGAKDGLELFTRIKDLASENRSPDQDQIETLNFHANVVSKSVADESGELLFDSDEGRDTLKQINFGELTELGTLVLKHSGYGGGDAKKNSPPNNSSPTDSALPSEETRQSTPTTSSNA